MRREVRDVNGFIRYIVLNGDILDKDGNLKGRIRNGDTFDKNGNLVCRGEDPGAVL